MKDRIGKNQSSHQSGFSLVEVLIAAVVMFFLLAGTNRMLVLAMASSSSSGIRMEIENQILNDIEEIQAIDTSLNNNPPCDEDGTDSAILKDKVESMRPVSRVLGARPKAARGLLATADPARPTGGSPRSASAFPGR
jgi:prepilin-type N-terminal cleavage/methylation domain-containing protein